MQAFEQFLASRNIDQQELSPELAAALRRQFEAEQESANPPEQKLVVLDGADDDQWQRAVWMVAG